MHRMKRNDPRRIILLTVLLCAALLHTSLLSAPEEINVRVDLLYPEGTKVLDPEQMVSINVCFDVTRSAQNYSSPFKYQIALMGNGKAVAKERGSYEPPEGIAIKRTTICKTFKFALKQLPGTTSVTLKADVAIDEAGGVKLKGESGPVEARVRSEYTSLTVSGTVLCPSDLPLSLVSVELSSRVPGSQRIMPGANTTTFTDSHGAFSATLLSAASSGALVIAKLFCPGIDAPSLILSGTIVENTCSFGTVILQCSRCGGPLASGEEEQMLPPRSPASITSPYEFIPR